MFFGINTIATIITGLAVIYKFVKKSLDKVTKENVENIVDEKLEGIDSDLSDAIQNMHDDITSLSETIEIHIAKTEQDMADVKKTLDSNGLLYFGQQYYAKLKTKFVALEEGKALSTNDFTTSEKEKLAGIAAGAQVNVLESVKVNGSALTPNSDKAVDITVVEGTNKCSWSWKCCICCNN